jgi:hypothetical protein
MKAAKSTFHPDPNSADKRITPADHQAIELNGSLVN